ncbi:MAG: hypothetical protein JRJ66_12400 [Deltaproteobacteria bacterium]|nr:hypothetical protein [Deltaproteobacteria bacterium]MBW1935933.1 hypothetical protein [Deltaproteobacteria bacterium]MBW2046104.1 hypothetical protein [Deltaproteobacteria bacterium]
MIKRSHGLAKDFEIKWVKISPARTDSYVETIDCFFVRKEDQFRAVALPDKGKSFVE